MGFIVQIVIYYKEVLRLSSLIKQQNNSEAEKEYNSLVSIISDSLIQ